MARGRQRHPVRHAERERVRPGHDVEQQPEVAGRARHRADNRQVPVDRQRGHGRRDHAPARRQPERRLVRVDPAEVGGGAQRTGDVGPDGQRPEPARQRRRRPSGGATGCTSLVPGVVGGPVHLVEALHVLQPQRHVGLAQHHRTRRPEPRHLHRVLGGYVVTVLGHPPGRGQPGDVVRLLDRHGDAQQRPLPAPGARPVGGAGGLAGAVEVRHAYRVDRPVVPLDTGDGGIGQLHRGHVTGAQGAEQTLGGRKGQVHARDRREHRPEP